MNAPFDPRRWRSSETELAGRVIAVTGASSGLGRAVAIDCARHGATVVLIGRQQKKLDAVLEQIEPSRRGDSSLAVFDLEHALAPDYAQLASAVLERYGRLDGLLHSAGMLGMLSPVEYFDVPTWCTVLHVNLTAAFALTKVLIPVLKRSADASILFTSSGVGRHGRAFWGAYAVSKFGIEGLAEVLAAELADITSIRVNTLDPGRARTRMREQAYPGEDPATLPTPESLTGPYLALLGPASRGITGGRFDAQ